MSYKSLIAATRDEALLSRTYAAAQREARSNPTFAATAFGYAIRGNDAGAAGVFTWPLALATEAEYAYALDAGIENPGADETVITDAMILAAVQAEWPQVWPAPLSPPVGGGGNN